MLPWAQTQGGRLRVETQNGTDLVPNADSYSEDAFQVSTELRTALLTQNPHRFLELILQWRRQHGAWPMAWNEYFAPYLYKAWGVWCADSAFINAIQEVLIDVCLNPNPVSVPAAPAVPAVPAAPAVPDRVHRTHVLESAEQAEKCLAHQDLTGAVLALCKAVRLLGEER